jgi:hypothetical protein
MEDVTPATTDAVQLAVAMMTVWAVTPDDHEALFAAMEELSAETLTLPDGLEVPVLLVGLVNLCGVALTDVAMADVAAEEDEAPDVVSAPAGAGAVGVLRRYGGFWGRVAAGLE